MKKIIILLAMSFCLADTNIGWVDPQYIFNQLEETREAQVQIEKRQNKLESDLMDMVGKRDSLIQDYQSALIESQNHQLNYPDSLRIKKAYIKALSYNGNKEIVIKTKKGSIKCSKLIIAMNAWAPSLLPFLSRSVILVSSDMIITEPIKNELQNLGLNNGLVILDSNLFTHYCRTTPDGKILFGKGGNTFSFRNKVIDSFDGPSTVEKFLS